MDSARRMLCYREKCGGAFTTLLVWLLIATVTTVPITSGAATAECSNAPPTGDEKTTRLFDPTPQELVWLQQAPVCERCHCAKNRINGGGICYDGSTAASGGCRLSEVRDCVLALMSRVQRDDPHREKSVHRVVNVLVKAGMLHEGFPSAFGTLEVRDGLAHWMGLVSDNVDAAVSLAASILVICEQEATAQRFASEGIRDGLLHLLDVVREAEEDDDDSDEDRNSALERGKETSFASVDRSHRLSTVLAAMNAVCSSGVGVRLCAVSAVRERIALLMPLVSGKIGKKPLSALTLVEGVAGFLANLCVTQEARALFGASSFISDGLLSFVVTLPTTVLQRNNATVRSIAGAILNLCVDNEANAQVLAGNAKLIPGLVALASAATTDESAHHVLGIVRALAGTPSARNKQQSTAPASPSWALAADDVPTLRDKVVLIASRSVQHAVTVAQFASALVNLGHVLMDNGEASATVAATTTGGASPSRRGGVFATPETISELFRVTRFADSPEASAAVAEALVAVSTDGTDEGRRIILGSRNGHDFIDALEALASQAVSSSYAANAVALLLAHVSALPESGPVVVSSSRVQAVWLRLAERVESDAGVRTVMAVLVQLCVNHGNTNNRTEAAPGKSTGDAEAEADKATMNSPPSSTSSHRGHAPPFSMEWVAAVRRLATNALLPLVTTDPTAAYFTSAISALASMPAYRSLFLSPEVRDALLRISSVGSSDAAARSIAAALQALCATPSGGENDVSTVDPNVSAFLTVGVRDALAKAATLTETPATAEVVAGAILNFCDEAARWQTAEGTKRHLCADSGMRDGLLLLFPVAHTDTTALRLAGVAWNVWKSSEEGKKVFGAASVMKPLVELQERISGEAFAMRIRDVIRQMFPKAEDALLEGSDDDDEDGGNNNADL